MLSVHGIAVSGPTFPAQIWHLFMDTAIGNRPDVPFPPAQTAAGLDVVARPVPVQRRLRDVDATTGTTTTAIDDYVAQHDDAALDDR